MESGGFSIILLLSVLSLCRAGLTPEQKQLLLDVHNTVRARVCNGLEPNQPKCSNVCVMQWDDRLERKAQQWADTCSTDHDTPQQRDIPAYKGAGIGQNGAFGLKDLANAVSHWYRELDFFSFESQKCQSGEQCGHYKQIIQFDSVLLGCGFKSDCSGSYKEILFCNYAPTGNRGGKQYTVGSACSNCPPGYGFCMNGLCAPKEHCSNGECTCALSADSCQNGGQFNPDKCSCECPQGYDGSTCAGTCKDNLPYCVPAMCDPSHAGYIEAKTECKKTCNACGKKFLPNDPNKENAEDIKVRVPSTAEQRKVGSKESVSHSFKKPSKQFGDWNEKPHKDKKPPKKSKDWEDNFGSIDSGNDNSNDAYYFY